jgi:hypothetical protein
MPMTVEALRHQHRLMMKMQESLKKDSRAWAISDLSGYRRTAGLCLVVVNAWALVRAFVQVPAWILDHNSVQLVGQFAYLIAFALVESVVVFAVLALLSKMVPSRFYRDNVAPQSAIVLTVMTSWAAFWQANMFSWQRFLPLLLIASLLVLLISIPLSWWLMRYRRVKMILNDIIDRLEILAALYLVIDIASLLVVLGRNLT